MCRGAKRGLLDFQAGLVGDLLVHRYRRRQERTNKVKPLGDPPADRRDLRLRSLIAESQVAVQTLNIAGVHRPNQHVNYEG